MNKMFLLKNRNENITFNYTIYMKLTMKIKTHGNRFKKEFTKNVHGSRYVFVRYYVK